MSRTSPPTLRCPVKSQREPNRSTSSELSQAVKICVIIILCNLSGLSASVVSEIFRKPESEQRGCTARLRPQPNDQVARPVLTGLALAICLRPPEMSSHKNIVKKQEVVGLFHREIIVDQHRFDDPNLPGEMMTTITLKKVMVGTELNIVQEGVPVSYTHLTLPTSD